MSRTLLAAAAMLCAVGSAMAQTASDVPAPRPDDHAPIGVTADHAHKAGGVMFGYRYSHMGMDGSLIGSDSVSPGFIATSVPNRVPGMQGGMGMARPDTLRSVPLDMGMDMQMFEAMYAPTDWVTLMAMGSATTDAMTMRTYQGDMGTDIAGRTDMRASGIGDTSLMAIFPLLKRPDTELDLDAGVSLPTGSTVESGAMLMPDGMRMRMRYPYAMQLGSGTYDLLPGLTWSGRADRWGWGAQYRGAVRTGENAKGYRFGDVHILTGWGSYEVLPWLSTSLRVLGQTTDRIRGSDDRIAMPSQEADPALYGGQRLDALVGANVLVPEGALKGTRFGLEVGAPFYQSLNGPQLAGSWELVFGVQRAF